MKSKRVLHFLSSGGAVLFALLITALAGCTLNTPNTPPAPLTEEQLIELVKSAHFEGYPDRTIGEYCDAYADARATTSGWHIDDLEQYFDILDQAAPELGINQEEDDLIIWEITSKGILDSKGYYLIFRVPKDDHSVTPVMFIYESENDGILGAGVGDDAYVMVEEIVDVATNGL